MATDSSFELHLSIRNAENGEPIVFKSDGSRFETSTRTLKLCSNARYKLSLICKPNTEFNSLHIAGSDLALHRTSPNGGEYTAEWNTTGIDPTRQATRQQLPITLQGPGGILKSVLQSKFYHRTESHAEWGQKLETLIWKCNVDNMGNITIVDEIIR
uniref:CB1 cannabinoid receptor-interacting protein 1 n=1 Tax=Parascaris univalens TaxID=6257 RepID=A0A915C921_PARUN